MDNFVTNPDTILTSAIEVGIGIAGFTGIILALLGKDRNPAIQLLLSALILGSFSTVMFSFLPLLFAATSFLTDILWTVCSATYLCYIVPIVIYRSRQLRVIPSDSLAFKQGGRMYGFSLH